MRFYNNKYTFYYIYIIVKKLIKFIYKKFIIYKYLDVNWRFFKDYIKSFILKILIIVKIVYLIYLNKILFNLYFYLYNWAFIKYNIKKILNIILKNFIFKDINSNEDCLFK